jgi:thiol-disulfide isomerase/thioredoxin
MAGKRFKGLLGWVLMLALFLGIQSFASRGLVTGSAPEIHAVSLDGQNHPGLAALPRPAVVYFWASWCSICRAMQGVVQDISQDTPVLTIATQSGSPAEVAKYLKETGFSVPVAVDEDGAVGAAYGLRGVPAVFIVDADGAIRYTMTGYSSAAGLRLRLWLTTHLPKP